MFITPTVTGANRREMREDIVLSYYLNKEEQVGPVRDRVDIFDNPDLFRNENENVRVLIPYCTGAHWVTCEVQISKRGLNVNTNVQLHDPYGNGLLNPALFDSLGGAVVRRIISNFNASKCSSSNKFF